MINILLVDDSENKAKKIKELLLSINGIESDCITYAPDAITAKKYLTDSIYDLMLLDIQLPNRFTQVATVEGGITLLKEIQRNPRLNKPYNIIGITAYSEVFDKVEDDFSAQMIKIIKYDESTDEWMRNISGSVEYLLSSKHNNLIPTRKTYNYDVAIICALKEVELESVLRLSENWEPIEVYNDSTMYYICMMETQDKRKVKVVAAAPNQMGMPSAAVLSMKIINTFSPRYLVMAGIAAGIKKEGIDFGDVLIADPSWDYGSGKIKLDKGKMIFDPDQAQIRINTDMLGILNRVIASDASFRMIYNNWPGEKPRNEFKLHIGPFASGAAVLAHSAVVDSIKRQNRKLIGIDMEAYGVMHAAKECSKPRPIAFSLKSVCDFANEEKDDRYQRYAAYTSASILKLLIEDYLEFE